MPQSVGFFLQPLKETAKAEKLSCLQHPRSYVMPFEFSHIQLLYFINNKY